MLENGCNLGLGTVFVHFTDVEIRGFAERGEAIVKLREAFRMIAILEVTSNRVE